MVKDKNKRQGKPKDPKPAQEGSQYFFFYQKSSPFSNFHPAPFVDEEGNSFFCSEQYMMYHKALLFEDYDIAAKILEERDDPARCKKLGRRVKDFDDEVWRANARRIVDDGLYFKFTQNRSLKRELLSTGDSEMVEASPRDRIWGIGYNADWAMRVPRSSWGDNWLGQVLMVVRGRIRREDEERRHHVISEYQV